MVQPVALRVASQPAAEEREYHPSLSRRPMPGDGERVDRAERRSRGALAGLPWQAHRRPRRSFAGWFQCSPRPDAGGPTPRNVVSGMTNVIGLRQPALAGTDVKTCFNAT